MFVLILWGVVIYGLCSVFSYGYVILSGIKMSWFLFPPLSLILGLAVVLSIRPGWEWCEDYYSRRYYNRTEGADHTARNIFLVTSCLLAIPIVFYQLELRTSLSSRYPIFPYLVELRFWAVLVFFLVSLITWLLQPEWRNIKNRFKRDDLLSKSS
jgi:hypothetical protein